MPHPNGGQGNNFRVFKSFTRAFKAVGPRGIAFRSTTGRDVRATQSLTRDGVTQVIRFREANSGSSASVCAECWGYRQSCGGTRIGQSFNRVVRGER
jgi:hypothetical protein